ncbi:unnamed protein product [Lepeophtheirus salmonis]|uniref:(salmon louse) hypothetical protein n=1 Tax=Lepeophtheirus salmonis TaxID=72036 RepID=A0A7R8CMA4_LEPSM|nr:unnamed protein product [Lepeophtheirus salmonis]CAF2865150.1 unnamed protein product [Lepeophtheirus salmonis]
MMKKDRLPSLRGKYKQSMFSYVFQQTKDIEIDNMKEDPDSDCNNIWISTDEISRRTLILNHYFHKWRDLISEIQKSKEMVRIHFENKLTSTFYSEWKKLTKQSKERESTLMILAQRHSIKVLKRWTFNGWLRMHRYTKECMSLKNLKLQRSSINQKIERFYQVPNIVFSQSKSPSIHCQKSIQNEKGKKQIMRIQNSHLKLTKLPEKPNFKLRGGNINLRLEKDILDLLDIKERLRHGRAIQNQVVLDNCRQKVILSNKSIVFKTKASTTTLDEQMKHTKRLSSLPDRSSSVTPIRNIIIK